MKQKMSVIHFLSDDYKENFINAKTRCGKYWQDVNDFTSNEKYVTCSKCKIENKIKILEPTLF